jgi:Transposase
MPTWVTWQTPVATILAKLSIWRCDWSWKTDCHIDRHPGIYGETIAFSFPGLQSRTGLKQRGKKAEQRITAGYLDGALADFSGYIAADELYDGPFCVLSIVDNRNFNRLIYEVLDHNPTHEDITRFFRWFRTELNKRGLELLGITTDGSSLYPEPLAEIFPGVGHQVCEFHVLKEINREILKALTQIRREFKKKLPKLKRGRPSSEAARKAARRKKKLQDKIADLFDHRYLFVKHSLTPREKKIFLRITRGLHNLRKLRSIMDQVYRLFDRRCRTERALEKLAKLRCRVRRFKTLGQSLKKLFTPNIEKALTFLDDSLLPSTSNAVERGYRRHRKMQNSIYRVRTQEHISQRIAIDMHRDERSQGRLQTITMLHHERREAL